MFTHEALKEFFITRLNVSVRSRSNWNLQVLVFRFASLVYLRCLRKHVLRAYCTFASKQAVAITLFGPRPNKKPLVTRQRTNNKLNPGPH